MGSEVDLSIIIVSWNTRELLFDCLTSVLAQVKGIQFEVIVFDNASTDGSPKMVARDFSDVKLVVSKENLGFAAGNNQALGLATGKFILLLNPDTLIVDDAIQQLYVALGNNPSVGIVGAQLLNPDGTPQTSWGRFPSLWTEIPLLNCLAKPQEHKFYTESTVPVDWVSGAALMTRRGLFEEVGLLDEEYWLYTEETDWCFRARRAGWEVAIVPTAHVIHIARAASRQAYEKTMLHFYHSRFLFLSKHGNARVVLLTKVILLLKTWIWFCFPTYSPLAQAYANLSVSAIRSAYVQLMNALLSSIEEPYKRQSRDD